MTDEGSTETREMGIEFGELAGKLDAEDYPIEREELLKMYGDAVLQLPNGTATLEDVLGIADESTYEDAESVRQAVFNLVGDDAVGREGYSDRAGPAPNQNDREQSF